ncbi:hypothetical protein ACNAW0_03275 [Micromonospora sp. SL1-18]|uniref:hypothetical protein n=1 Tax=Micromonospora sp. SL1-18 TaxID=3399128 RepID=UPI003A4D769A
MDDPEFREFVEIRYADLLRTAYLLMGSRDAAFGRETVCGSSRSAGLGVVTIDVR